MFAKGCVFSLAPLQNAWKTAGRMGILQFIFPAAGHGAALRDPASGPTLPRLRLLARQQDSRSAEQMSVNMAVFDAENSKGK